MKVNFGYFVEKWQLKTKLILINTFSTKHTHTKLIYSNRLLKVHVFSIIYKLTLDLGEVISIMITLNTPVFKNYIY